MDLDYGVKNIIPTTIKINNPFTNYVEYDPTKYDRILILSSTDNININDYTSFTEDEYINFCKKLYIYKASKSLLYNSHHISNLNLINYDKLKYIKVNFELNNEELVCCIWGIKKNVIKLYLEQYTPSNNFNNYLLIKDINYYFDINNSIANYNRNNYLISLKESNYWTIFNNCKKNITLQFLKRNFKTQINYITEDKLKKDLNEIENNDNDYLLFMKRPEVYTDISNTIDSVGYNKYIINNNISYKKETITDIIKNICNEHELYNLIANLLISKDLCHLIINNKDVLKLLHSKKYFLEKFKQSTTFIKKYFIMLKYCIGYSWIIFYMEESIKKTMINEDDRFVLDINTANLLPYFPYISDKPKTSPYFSLLVSDKALDFNKNNLTFGCTSHKSTYMTHGVTNLEQFKSRLETFCTGSNSNKYSFSIFDNINWNDLAITGSVISACLPINHPLSLGKTDNTYYDTYYKNSDLDIMCKCDSITDFIKEVYSFYDCIKQNIYRIDKEINTEIIPVKSLVVYVSPNYINKYLISDNNSYDNIVTNLNTDNNIKKYIYDTYTDYHFKKISKYVNDNIFKDNKYNDYFEPILYENMKIFLSNKDNFEEDIYYYNNLKYKIKKNKIIQRDFEIFKVKYSSFFSCVSKFHLPCVRAYYTNNNVYILPSCISSMMTFLNIDYKYFAGTNSPYAIINKYRERGYATLLNDTEKINNIEYIVKYTDNKYRVNINNSNSILNLYGFKYLDNYNISHMYNSHNFNFFGRNYITIKTTNNYINEIKKITNPECLQYIKNHINENGYIQPFKKYIIELIFDKLYN